MSELPDTASAPAPHKADPETLVLRVTGGAYKRITVMPTVDFRSLEEVLVVLTPMAAQDVTEGKPE